MFVKIFRPLSPLLLAIALVLVGGALPAGAAQANYVALGDSYASGTGAGAYGDSGGCRRSANAYPELWADANGAASFTFAACSGATTSDVLSQAGALSASTTLVTVSVGGNDAGFVDVMIDCTLGGDQACVERVAEARSFAQNTLPGRLDDVYATLKSSAPNALIVVLGYPRLYEMDGSCNAGLSETKRAAINSGADTLAAVIGARAAAAGLTFVDMRGPFTGHEICSSGEWWLNSLTWPVDESYHPNVAGHAEGYLPALESITG